MLTIRIRATFDAEAAVWTGEAEAVPGLVTEATTLEALAERVAAVLPDLMDLPADGAEVIVEASAHRRIPQAA